MEKDIKEMFREKNKSMIITNLKYDLEKNFSSLLEIITNILNLNFDMAIKNMVSIYEDSNIFDSEKFVTDTINIMKLECYQKLESLLAFKRTQLEERIDGFDFEETSMNEYYDFVFQTTKDLKTQFLVYLTKEMQEKKMDLFHQFMVDKVDSSKEELAFNRITDYVKNRLCGKIETKVHMEIMLRDNNLINKAKESYLRYQEISIKTT